MKATNYCCYFLAETIYSVRCLLPKKGIASFVLYSVYYTNSFMSIYIKRCVSSFYIFWKYFRCVPYPSKTGRMMCFLFHSELGSCMVLTKSLCTYYRCRHKDTESSGRLRLSNTKWYNIQISLYEVLRQWCKNIFTLHKVFVKCFMILRHIVFKNSEVSNSES